MLKEILDVVYHFFIVSSIIVIVSGFSYTVFKVFLSKDKVTIKVATREYFDNSILIGLQLLIVADIIETIIAQDLASIGRVSAVVLIRTIMSFSLHWEQKHSLEEEKELSSR